MASEFPKYTDQQRTRVVERGSVYTRPRENASIGSTQPIMKQERLLEGISVPQILASAAAAATSMLLASKIGIAGSVIGAAVSSTVTIIATQLYRRALTAGARKLQQAGHGAAQASLQETTNLPGRENPYADAKGARVAPTKLQARAAAQRAATQRKITIASIAVAAATLAIVTAVILMGTAGEGLGTRPNPLLANFAEAPNADASDAEATTDAVGDQTAQGQADQQGASSDYGDAGASDGTAANSGNQTTQQSQGAAGGQQDQSAGSANDGETLPPDDNSTESEAAGDAAGDSGSSGSSTSDSASADEHAGGSTAASPSSASLNS